MPDDLLERAKAVLEINDRGNYTQPAEDLYPHQWLWDSCFIAIGLRHLDIDRAQLELKSLLLGQWHNGMMPDIIFRPEIKYRTDRDQWRSWLNPFAPDGVSTSGITQPPMLAEAVYQVGMKLGKPERRLWYKLMLPSIIAFHEWLYHERDPHQEGLTLQIHPWETGLDNTPPWMAELHEHLMPLWIRWMEKLKLDKVVNRFRNDTRVIPVEQRSTMSESLAMYDTQLRLRRKSYDINKILTHSLFAIEDLTFNCILIRANSRLEQIAKTVQAPLPNDLQDRMQLSKKTLEELWDPYSGQYYSRDFVTHRLLKTPSIATLMPLYAGSVTDERASQLVKLLENEHIFGTAYPVPSVPPSSFMFDRHRYWQGPSWINTNWLVIQGLKTYGFKDHAAALSESTIEMVDKSGFYEYFDPLNGKPLGAPNFSWTASLIIDLMKSKF
ncbi:MAG TPA: trehalase family glycosidase [Candidatus Saccharimonadales bacterium]|nr:trehalase family glycosidase [Candidatus Saccharimonadales bacterium]